MADKIDRSVEPELGADDKKKVAQKSTELSPGVRVRARDKKDAPSKKKTATSQKKINAKAVKTKAEAISSESKQFDTTASSESISMSITPEQVVTPCGQVPEDCTMSKLPSSPSCSIIKI